MPALLTALSVFGSVTAHAAGRTELDVVKGYASQLAGGPVTVSCEADWSFTHGLRGYTMAVANADGSLTFSRTIHLPRAICNALERLVDGNTGRARASFHGIASTWGPRVDDPDGSAVHVLLHEALHIREDSGDEARVECDTSLNAWSALRLFKLAAWQDREILQGMAIAHEDSPASYRTVC